MNRESTMIGGDFLWDRSGPPDPAVQQLERTLGACRHAGREPELVIGPRPEMRFVDVAPPHLAPPVVAAPNRGRFMSAAAMITLAIIAGFVARPALGPWFKVESQGGSPRIGLREAGERLHVGQWLKTDGDSSARIEVAALGHVTVNPNSKIRIKRTGDREHLLEMPYGQIRAFITAPPRVFLVDTPAARAVDMGCEYTLNVDEDGSGILRVTLGHVLLEGHGRTSTVPMMGGTCRTRPGFGPGTPYFDDASIVFINALDRLDFGIGSDAELDHVLHEARERDALSLWHLMSRTNGPQRLRVFERLASLKQLPATISRQAVLDLNPDALGAWFEHMRPF